MSDYCDGAGLCQAETLLDTIEALHRELADTELIGRAAVDDLQTKLASMTAERNFAIKQRGEINDELVASQAYSKQLRDALEQYSNRFENNRAYKALALPHDDTALKQYGAKVLRDAVQNGLEGLCSESGMRYLLNKADELDGSRSTE
jgi:hypothetical protein